MANPPLLRVDSLRPSLGPLGPTVWRRTVAYVARRPVMLAGTVEANFRAAFPLVAAEGRGYPAAEAEYLLDASEQARNTSDA